MSSLIKRMTDRKRKLVLTTGHGESDFSQGLQALQQAVNQEFDTSTVNPSSAAIPADTDALLVAGPKQPFDDKGRKEIDKFLMQGKGAIFLVDGMVMSAPRGGPEQMMGGGPKVGQANNTGLDELLKPYGFEVEQDFVLDKQSAPGPVDLGGRKMLANQPVFVGTEILQPQDKEKSFTLTAGIPAVVFPFPSSVKLVGPLAGGKPANGKVWRLAHSSSESWKVSGFFFFSPGTQKIEETNDKGPFDLAYAYEGPLKSAYPSADGGRGHVGAHQRHPFGVQEARPPAGGRRLGLRVRRVLPALALLAGLRQRRAVVVERDRLDAGGRSADAGAHQDHHVAADPGRLRQEGPGAEGLQRVRCAAGVLPVRRVPVAGAAGAATGAEAVALRPRSFVPVPQSHPLTPYSQDCPGLP